jgi:hypothetical protein
LALVLRFFRLAKRTFAVCSEPSAKFATNFFLILRKYVTVSKLAKLVAHGN